MSSGVFRGKEFSNRIKLSQLVWGLLTVGDLGLPAALGKGQMEHRGVPRHVHAYMLTCTHMKC